MTGDVLPMPSSKMSPESARDELDRFLDLMDLDHKFEELEDPEEVEAAKGIRRVLTRAIRVGRLTIEQDGVAVLHPQEGDAIRFDEPTGAAMQAMDKRKDGRNVAKMYSMLAEWTGQPAVRFSKMKHRDLSVAMKLTQLFLA